jgi:radical SAM-linked protein
LKYPGIRFKWQNPQVSLIEGLWARGDRRLNDLLISAYQKGCRFDGWTDKFRYDLWQEAFAAQGIDPDFYTVRRRDLREPLPWDHIDTQVSKVFLQDEWHKAIQAAMTGDCRNGDCHQCGVCDFEIIEPITYPDEDGQSPDDLTETNGRETSYKKMILSYSKRGAAKYYGHLELVNIFLRALKRAGIPVKFTEGFHPKPKVSFDDPLPIGLESENEKFSLSVPVDIRRQDIVEGLNAHLPSGLRVQSEELAARWSDKNTPKANKYRVTLEEGSLDRDDLTAFTRSSDFTIEIEDRKGKLKKLDLKDMVLNIDLIDSRQLQMVLRSEPGKTLRPATVLRHIFGLPDHQIKKATVIKLRNGSAKKEW